MIEQEIWKDVEDYEGRYQVSNLGRMKSLGRDGVGSPNKDIILKLTTTPNGYITLDLRKHNIREKRMLHRVVAKAFVPNPDSKPEVNHKDGDKLNNRVDNLEWCTRSENLTHAHTTGLKIPVGTGKFGKESPVAKAGSIVNPEGVVIDFDSQVELVKKYKLHPSGISQVLSGKIPHHMGWTKQTEVG